MQYPQPPDEPVSATTFFMMTSSNGNISTLLTFVRGIHWSPVNSPQKGQWRGALMFPLICAFRSKRFSKQSRRRWWETPHYDVIVMHFVFMVVSISQAQSNPGSGQSPVIHHGICWWSCTHYIDVIMTTMASQITSLTVVYSTVYSDADQSKHQSSASLAFVWGIHRDRWIPRTKGQLRGKCFHLMTSSCWRRTQ